METAVSAPHPSPKAAHLGLEDPLSRWCTCLAGKLMLIVNWEFSWGYQTWDLVCLHGDISPGLFGLPHNMAAKLQDVQVENTRLPRWSSLIGDVPVHHFFQILLASQVIKAYPDSRGGEPDSTSQCREAAKYVHLSLIHHTHFTDGKTEVSEPSNTFLQWAAGKQQRPMSEPSSEHKLFLLVYFRLAN